MTEEIVALYETHPRKVQCEALADALEAWADAHGARYRRIARAQAPEGKKYDDDHARMNAALDVLIDGLQRCEHVPRLMTISKRLR